MIPHERSLVKRLEGKAFVLLGVNSDPDPEQLTSQLREHRVTWRSFKNKRVSDKNIDVDWLITSWPTLFLIDHHGIIRKKWEGSPDPKELDQAIDKLVSVAEKE
jgi:peroxiredoxin